jgi:iron complex transport system substrate-binding protein
MRSFLPILLLAAAGPLLAATPNWRISDDEGRALVLAGPPQRIVSLSPGATAMLFAAGGGSRVVGTSEYSLEPAAAAQLPRISDSHGFDLERILSLHPDLVIAWADGASAAQLAPLERAGLTVYRHRVHRLDDLPAALERFGLLLGTSAVAGPEATALRVRIGALRERFRSGTGPRLLIQVWDRPVYTVGGSQLISDVAEACGYRNVFADLPDAAPAVTLEAIAARDPEAILAIAEDPHRAQDWLAGWRALPALRAVRTGRLLAFVDARLSRLGPEVVAAAEDLCRVLAAPAARAAPAAPNAPNAPEAVAPSPR